ATNVAALSVKPDRLAERDEEALAATEARPALHVMTELQLETVRLAPGGPNDHRARTRLAEWRALPPRRPALPSSSPPRRCARPGGGGVGAGGVGEVRAGRGGRGRPARPRERRAGRYLVLCAQPGRSRRGLEPAHADPRLARHAQCRRGGVARAEARSRDG